MKVETIGGKIEHRLNSNDHDGLFHLNFKNPREITEKLLGF